MADPKRQAFRSYLEDGGVIDALNRAMLALSQQNPFPSEPLALVREQIGAPPIAVDIDALIRQNQDLTAEAARLEFELELKKMK
jgi:hypothetical protein